jgi:hypothetical protein
VLLIKYREPPLTLEKSSRLITFLHHFLKVIPIIPTTTTIHKISFPLGTLVEDMILTLSTQQPAIWIISIQFLLSCLRSASQQYIYQAGVTTPVILSVIKHVLLEFTKLPSTSMTLIQEKCFSVGKELLDLFLIRDHTTVEDTSTQQKFNAIGTISYYDVIHSVSLGSRTMKKMAYVSFVCLYIVSRVIWALFKCNEHSCNYSTTTFHCQS